MKTANRSKLLAAIPGVLVALVVVMFVAGAFWNSGRTEREAMELVKRSLRDPDSAQFRNVSGGCGEVNAKNAYGAMAGFEPFYVRVTPGRAAELIMGQGAALVIALECKPIAEALNGLRR